MNQTIKIKSCYRCPFNFIGYCEAHPAEFYVGEDARNNVVHRLCPLKQESIIVELRNDSSRN